MAEFIASTFKLSSGKQVTIFKDKIRLYSADSDNYVELTGEELGEIFQLVSRPNVKNNKSQNDE